MNRGVAENWFIVISFALHKSGDFICKKYCVCLQCVQVIERDYFLVEGSFCSLKTSLRFICLKDPLNN